MSVVVCGVRVSTTLAGTYASTLSPFTAYGLNHILSTGQSNSVGQGTVAETTTQPYDNLMFLLGPDAHTWFEPISGALVPLVEGPEETMSSALANLLTEMAQDEGLTHRSLVSIHGVGSAAYTALKKGTVYYERGMEQVAGGIAHATSMGLTYVVRCVTNIHGETDSINGNTGYAANLVEWQSDYETDVQALTGQTEPVPMFITQVAMVLIGSPIPQACLDAHVDAPGKVVLVGPRYHLNHPDNLHLDAASQKHIGEDHAKAYRKVVLEGGTWEPVRPRAISRIGNVVTVSFYVPEPPLVFDTTLVASKTNRGFDWSGGGVSISSVELVGTHTVRITLSGTPASGGTLSYALTSYPLAGNLRDSDATESRYGFNLANWCVHFSETVS